MTVQQAYRQEEERLGETLAEIARQRAAIPPVYHGDDFLEQVLEAKRAEARERLDVLGKEPYFGRLDWQERGQPDMKPLYIGKRGMDRSDVEEPYIIDWRAPVAGLFYSFTGGDETASYEAPEGTIEGAVHLKRNLAIRERTLDRVVDTYVRGGDNLGVSDEFLLYRLGENKDNRLRDIVSTIQAEQDRIIRAPRQAVLLIQGAAGSGKTTVALHRLAYLLYEYREQVKAERMIIFAPNAMFLDYISGVLPELGVGNIRQTTFADWALELLDGSCKLADEREEAKRWFALSGKRPPLGDDAPGRAKGSLRFKEWLDRGLERLERAFLPDADLVPWEGARLTAATIRGWFADEYRHYPLAMRRERLAARMKRWLEMQLQAVHDPAQRKAKTAAGRTKLNAYVKKLPDTSPLAVYKLLFGLPKPAEWTAESAEAALPEELAASTRKRLAKNVVAPEDLAPLLWIRARLSGTDNETFDHIVVDEAQDASPLQIAVMNAHMKGAASFTILGDLAQGIYSFRGIERWEEHADVFAPVAASYFQLKQSYRSTMEIIAFANGIMSQAGTGLEPAVPVFRSGDPVQTLAVKAGATERIAAISGYVGEALGAGLKTVAVIGRTGEDCRSLHAELAGAGVEASLIAEDQLQYRGGVSIVPVYLAKGLEFDAVLIADCDARRYAANAADAKLLYVGCTRALHKLCLMHAGEPSPLLAIARESANRAEA
ncbi:MAG: UvrD-helicase domain-containing protein [Paenibacillaceae bacterium]|nr:UvrD-helicase domain-containing protein [Paenibacillaceae bacterium]